MTAMDRRDVLFVVTQANSVFALDARTGADGVAHVPRHGGPALDADVREHQRHDRASSAPP
jgi:hypothetical protein